MSPGNCAPSFTDCLIIDRAIVYPHSDPWRKLKIISLLIALTAWTQGLHDSFSGDIPELDAFIRWSYCISSWIRDLRWSCRLMPNLRCSTSLINSLENYHQGLQVTLKATAGWGWLTAPWSKVRADGCALGQLEPEWLHTQLQTQWVTTIQPGGDRLISSSVQVFVWEGKLEKEVRLWKLMVSCHPSLPRVWDVPLHLPQREQLFVERRKHRKTLWRR